jgi:hypothetical protein
MAIKRASPARRIIVVTLANDCPAYIPNEVAYDQGGYEPEWSPCARGVGKVLEEAGVRVIRKVLGGQ